MKKLSFILAMVFAASFSMAQNNDATIDQYGTNIGKILQTGDQNTADIDQGSSTTSVTNWGTNGASDWKWGSYVTQTGDENTAIVDVNTSSNGTDITQIGDFNYGKQELNASGSYTTSWAKMGVDLEQTGNSNVAYQTTAGSFGSSPIHGLTAVQTGHLNYVNQLSIGGGSNIQTSTQIGNKNNNPTESGHVLDVSATGLANPLMTLPFAYGSQTGYTSVSNVTQYSNQMGGRSIVNILGNDNNTYQYQEYAVWSVSGRNKAELNVVGSTNDVIQAQKGDFNESYIDIDGSGNTISSSQYGNSNKIDIDLINGSNLNIVGVQQTGNFNTAKVLQSGVTNFAQIIQQP